MAKSGARIGAVNSLFSNGVIGEGFVIEGADPTVLGA